MARTTGHVFHTDDLMHLEWSEASLTASQWFSQPGDWTVEGVAAVRALRKWMSANPGKPCDRVVWLSQPKVTRTPGQNNMAKACETIWREILPELRSRGVEIETR